MKYVYSDAWIFTGLGVPMSFPETYAIFETTINVHEVTLSVDAGPDAIVNEGETFTGSGSFTDEDEDTWTATVDYGDGSGVQPLALDSTNKTFTFDHVYADDGVYTVRVTVTDKEGEVGTDVVTVTVTDFGPTAALTGDTVFDEGSPGSYDASGSASSPDAIVLYEWDWNYDGTTFNPSGDTGAVQIHAWMDNDTYTAAVRVTDDDGSTDIAVLEVTIIDFAPTAAFTWAPEPQDEGSSVSFTDTSTSVSDLITAWSWDFGGLGTGNEQNPNFTFNDDGTFTVTLTVTDDDGSTSTVSHDVTINNVAPAIVAGDDMAANEGEMLNFEGSFVDPGTADTHTFQWDFGDGASASGSLTPTHAYGDNGAYTVTLTVTDDDGGVGFDNLIVTVSNVPPMVEAGPDQAGESCVHEISLSGFFTDPGWLDTHTATIDWGDGTIEPGLVTEENNPPDSTGNLTGSHKYIIPGIYTVTLVVTDDDGDTGIDTLTVTATDTIAPDINLISPEATTYLNTQEPIPIDYTVTDMCDPDPEMKFYLDGEEFTEDSIHLGIYLGESEHTLRVEATDSSGNVGEVSVTFTVVPEQMKSILIKHMKIRWELPHWGKCWGWGNKTTFMIHGRLELPDEYKSADLDKSAFLNILIADKEGKDKVIFKEKKKLWRYHEPSRWKNRVDDSLDQGIDIKSMIIHWQSEKESKYWWFNTKCKHSWFYVRGELSLEGINIKTLPKEATVTLEIPVAPSGEAGSLVAEETIKFKKFWHIWFYHTWNKWGGWKDGWWKKWDRD
jgi:PKD repeat protein